VTAKHRVVEISGDQPEEGTDGYGGKDFPKRVISKRASLKYKLKSQDLVW